ncbi:hypothetical protein GCM10026982_13550 [Nocardiopsis aegyptia]
MGRGATDKVVPRPTPVMRVTQKRIAGYKVETILPCPEFGTGQNDRRRTSERGAQVLTRTAPA